MKQVFTLIEKNLHLGDLGLTTTSIFIV